MSHWRHNLQYISCLSSSITSYYYKLKNTPKGRCAPPPIAASLLPKKFKKINYFQKQSASLQAQTRPASGVYFSTGLSCTLLNYITSYWVTQHPIELRCTLISYAAFNWSTPHPIWAKLHPSELRCTLSELSSALRATLNPLSYATAFWATLHPSELWCTLLSYASP